MTVACAAFGEVVLEATAFARYPNLLAAAVQGKQDIATQEPTSGIRVSGSRFSKRF